MVSIRRSGVYHRGLGHGTADDTRPGLPLFGPGEEEISAEHALGNNGIFLRHHISVVLLGLFAGILDYGNEWLHWRFASLWSGKYAGATKWCNSSGSFPLVCVLSSLSTESLKH